MADAASPDDLGRLLSRMAAARPSQLNIRSRFARERVATIAARTGMTATQVVEEALRAYQPQDARAAPAGLVRKGGLLVKPAGGARVTLSEANAALDDDRAAGRA